MCVQCRFANVKLPGRILKIFYSDKTTSDFIDKFCLIMNTGSDPSVCHLSVFEILPL